ncbi:unnamed protein product [Closterium sp. NIES-53]
MTEADRCLWQPHCPALPTRRPAGRHPALRWPRAALPWPSPCPARFPSARAPPCLRVALLVTRHPALPAMASLNVLTFEHEGHSIQFNSWLDDLQLYLLSDSRDSVLLFDHTSGASLAPPAIADSATRSQWLTRDAAARLAIRNHLPLAERTHFGQHKTAKALYNAVVARYSSPATSALGRLILPYLFPELSAFATVEDPVTHLRTSDTRYRAALPAEFLDRNPPSMYITLYFIVTRLPDSLRAVRDHFLALDPTDLTFDLLEKHLLAAETSVVTVGAARGTPHTPFFEGCSPSPLAPSYASSAAVDILGAEDVGAASALSGKRRSSKGKGGKGAGGGSEGGGGGGSGGGGGGGVGGSGGSGDGIGGFGGGGGGSGGGGGGGGGGSGSGGGASGGGRGGAVQRGSSSGGQRQQQQRPSETPTPQQLREWFAQRGASGDSVRCPYVISTGDRAGQTCRKYHTQHRCFSCLDDAWCAEFGDEAERPRWLELLRSGVDIFALDYDAILAAMYALSFSAEGDCYLCVPPDPGIEAAALGTSESALLGTLSAEALHTITLDSSASHCFFRDSTTPTPLPEHVPVRLADPSGGPVLARSSTVLPCPAVLSGSLSGLHLPSFSTNLVSTAALQDAIVTTTTPGGQRVSICTCTRTGRHLATFTRRPGSSLYTLTAEPPRVAASGQVFVSGPEAAPCSCRLLSHQTLLWHHRLGHPSLPRLRGMHSRLLVFGLPKSLPPLPPSLALPLLPCVEGRQSAAPHSSSFPPTTAPLQTLHMDLWGPARVSGHDRECYFLLVVDDYTRYTTIFPLHSKCEVPDILIPWIHAVRLELRERFCEDLPVLRLHSDKGESRIGLVMEVARTSMIHAAAPHFLWLFAVWYAAHQLTFWPRVSLPKTSPTLRWTGKVGDASVFRVWGSRAFVRNTSADNLSSCAIPCVFFGFPPDAPSWQFYDPTSRCVFPSHNVMFDESVPFYRPPPVDPLPPHGPAPSVVSQVDPLPSTAPVEVAIGSGAALGAASGGAASRVAEPRGSDSEGAGSGGAEPGGAEPGGAEPGGVERGGAEPGGVEPGGAASEGAESGGAEARGSASSGGPVGAPPRQSPRPEPLSPRKLSEWFAQRTHLRSGVDGDGLVGFLTLESLPLETLVPEVLQLLVLEVLVPRVLELSGMVVLGELELETLRSLELLGLEELELEALALEALELEELELLTLELEPASPLPTPSPYGEHTDGLTERHEPASRRASPVRTGRRVPHPRPPPVHGTHAMALRPSSIPLRVPPPAPPASSLPAIPDPESAGARAASPTVSRLLATAVTDPSFESTAASALVAELVDFAAASCLDYSTALVAESVSASPPSVGGECALGTDVLEDRQVAFECLAAAVPRFASMLLAPEEDPDAPDIPTLRSYAEEITGTYVDVVPPSRANIVDGMWIFRRDYELHSLDFSIAFLQGSLHEEIWLRRPPGFTRSFSGGTQWSLRRPVYGLHQAPCEWHDTLRTTLLALGFTPSTANPSLSLRTDTSLPPFYVLVYVDDLVFATADTEALTFVKSELQERHTCIDLGELRSYLGLQITRDRALRTVTLSQSHMVHHVLQRFGFQFSSPQPTHLSTSHSLSAPPSDESYVGHGARAWRTGSSCPRCSSCEAEIYVGAMVAQKLCWLTYVLTDLGERPRSSAVLYVDSKAMIALCEEHRLEHRTKHIALQYFLARELQQCGQLRLTYVATRANTADIFTKALLPGDH